MNVVTEKNLRNQLEVKSVDIYRVFIVPVKLKHMLKETWSHL